MWTHANMQGPNMVIDPNIPPVRLSARPLYAFLVQFPAVCFVGALLCDIAYWRTTLYTWETFSVWLLAAGCVMAGLAGIVGLFEFVRDRRLRAWRLAWPHALMTLLALALAIANAFVHSRDGYTAVVPEGLALSIVVVVLMFVVTVMGWSPSRTVSPVRVAA